MAYAVLFTAGLASSLHCVGMCGPFAVAIAGGQGQHSWLRSALYNLARVNTLAVIGAFCGAFGAVVVASGAGHAIEQGLAVAAGTLMLVVGFEMLGIFGLVTGRFAYGLQRWLGELLGGVIRSRSLAAPVALGVFNAFLPCHLIYAFAARAASTGSVTEGALTMTAFGLGTIPALVALGAVRRWAPAGAVHRLSLVSAIAVIGFGVVTLVRAFDGGAQCVGHH